MRWIIPALFLISTPANAVPVVPQFTQGALNSHSETTTKVNETITSVDINTGWQYSVTGTNIQHSGSSISPSSVDIPRTVSGVSTTWTGLEHNARPNWTIVTPGAAFQFNEVYTSPGVSNVTTIQRETESTTTVDTTSIFQQ